MLEVLLGCLILFVVAPLLTVLVGNVVMVRQLSAHPVRLEALEDDSFAEQVEQADAMDRWAQTEGFGFSGCYQPTGVGGSESFMAIWQYQDTPTFFTMTYIQMKGMMNWSIEFNTHFSPDVMLDTGSTPDAWLLPRPSGYYRQSFSGLDAAGLWERHQEGMRYLMREGHLSLPPMRGGLEDLFEKSMARQMAYILSLPFWYLRGPYWYFVRRRRYHGLSLEEQRLRGMIRMPNELAWSSDTCYGQED